MAAAVLDTAFFTGADLVTAARDVVVFAVAGRSVADFGAGASAVGAERVAAFFGTAAFAVAGLAAVGAERRTGRIRGGGKGAAPCPRHTQAPPT